MHPIHGIVKDALETDLTQMLEAGHDEAALRRELDEASAKNSTDALLALQEDWWARPSPDGFPYDEPSDWETISSHFEQRSFTASIQGRCGLCPSNASHPSTARWASSVSLPRTSKLPQRQA